ncbi:MAG TPA: hypothetical protein VN673_17945 [Clostridia bacterium]|nr:hypothetical protein [Clostridia bacterium]
MKLDLSFLARRRGGEHSGWSLVELLVTLGIASLVLMAVMQVSLFTARSFAAMGNYADLDRASRNALDLMSREIREGKIQRVGYYRLGFTNKNGSYFAYRWNPGNKTVARLAGPSPSNITSSNLLLAGCDYFKFRVFLRNPTNQFWFPWEATGQEGNTKLVDLSWKCSRRVLSQYNTESVQTAKIVLRN